MLMLRVRSFSVFYLDFKGVLELQSRHFLFHPLYDTLRVCMFQSRLITVEKKLRCAWFTVVGTAHIY